MKLVQGSAEPVYLVDPLIKRPVTGSAIPIYLVDANGNYVSWSDISIGNVANGNYVRIYDEGIKLFGTAASWDDLRVAASAVRVTGANQPSWNVIPGTTGLYTWHFGATGIDEIWFQAQMPHSWLEGSDIEAHVHWIPNANGGANQVVEWSLDYSWANIGSVIPAETSMSATTHTPADASLVQGKHYLTELGTIVATGKTISSMLSCRLFRDGGNDDFANTAALLEIDFHYQIDSFGSNDEYVK